MIKKILVLESSYLTEKPWGGSAKEARLVTRALLAEGYSVTIAKNTSFLRLLLMSPRCDLILGFGSPFFGGLVGLLGARLRVPVWFYVDHLRYLKEAFLEELRLVKKSRPDFWERVLKSVEATKANIPNIWRDERLLSIFLSKCEVVFASQYLKNMVSKKIDFEKNLTLPVVYPILPQNLKVKGEFKGQKDEKLILYFGWLHYKRGVIDVVKAFDELSGKFENLRLIIAGYPIQLESLHYLKTILSKSKNLQKKVKVMGKKSEGELATLISSASMVVFPFHFPFSVQPPLSLIEAMSQGKLVVATKVGAIPEIVTDGKNGLLCRPRDTSGLRRKMEWVLEHKDGVKALEREAKRTSQRFSQKTLVSEVLNNLKKKAILSLYEKE